MSRLILATGFAGEIITWSPLVQAVAVISISIVILVVTLAKSDKPTRRLVALIQAVRGSLDRQECRNDEGGATKP